VIRRTERMRVCHRSPPSGDSAMPSSRALSAFGARSLRATCRTMNCSNASQASDSSTRLIVDLGGTWLAALACFLDSCAPNVRIFPQNGPLVLFAAIAYSAHTGLSPLGFASRWRHGPGRGAQPDGRGGGAGPDRQGRRADGEGRRSPRRRRRRGPERRATGVGPSRRPPPRRAGCTAVFRASLVCEASAAHAFGGSASVRVSTCAAAGAALDQPRSGADARQLSEQIGPQLDPATTCESWSRRTKPLHSQRSTLDAWLTNGGKP
jgi:hypothetical protein